MVLVVVPLLQAVKVLQEVQAFRVQRVLLAVAVVVAVQVQLVLMLLKVVTGLVVMAVLVVLFPFQVHP
jgi:hypothetical protein